MVIAASTRMRDQVGEPDLALDEIADDERIDASDDAGLGRGEDARQDAAHDDERRKQPGPGRAHRAPQGAEIEAAGDFAQLRIVRMIGVELHGDHQRDADQDPRDDPAEEQAADRDLRDRAVDHHGHARRDDRPDGAGGRDQGGGKPGLVAGLLHGRDDDRADRRCVRGGRARHAGDRHAGDDRGMREAGAEMADQRAREIDQLPADPARRHDRSGEDEIGHRQQREGIELGEHLLRKQRHHEFGQHRDPDEADQRDAQQDRNPDQHRSRAGASAGNVIMPSAPAACRAAARRRCGAARPAADIRCR